MSTEVKWAEGLTRDLVRVREGLTPGAERIFLAHEMLVIDDLDWHADLGVIRSGLVPKHRAFKADYIEKPPTREVQREVDRVIEHAKQLFLVLYPDFDSIEERTSFRPMITGPEPLHFDSYGGKNPMVTAYINVSNEPRVYRISHNFQQLVDLHPDMVRAAYKERKKPEDDASYPIRMRTMAGKPPLDPNAPRHEVRLAPGAIWFFNAKTVSHEVVYGTGAIGISWEVPGCGAKLQHDILKEMK